MMMVFVFVKATLIKLRRRKNAQREKIREEEEEEKKIHQKEATKEIESLCSLSSVQG